MASMGSTGLTPLPSTQDGLGLNTSMMGAPSAQDGHASKNPQKERHDRLKEIAQLLKRKTQSRGLSRHNVETLAKNHGFVPFDDEDEPDTLTLAGKEFVVVDVMFRSSSSDLVSKATLKLSDPPRGEDEMQEEASQVLTRNLTVKGDSDLSWHDLTDLSANLEYLRQVESVSTGTKISCFSVLDNLYNTFQAIWIAEKKRMSWRHDLHHLCQSNIGEPAKDIGHRLGLSARYWTSGQNFYAKQRSKTEAGDAENEQWTARFTVEAGPPSMAASQKWLAENALTSTARAEDIFQDFAVDKPSWQDPMSSLPQLAKSADSMDIDPSPSPTTLDMHFVCDLAPEIRLPWHVVQSLRENGQTLGIRQSQATTFQQSLHKTRHADFVAGARWTRPQHVFGEDGTHMERTYSYTLYTTGQYYIYPVHRLTFSHPRQFADVLPVLRQYALINSLLQSIAPLPDRESNTKTPEPAVKPAIANGKELVIRDGKEIWVRSNKSKLNSKFDKIMQSARTLKPEQGSAILIDVQLDTISAATTTKTCKFSICVPISTTVLSWTAIERLKAKKFLKLEMEILLNGIVEVTGIVGVELERQKLDLFKKRLARVVRCSDDDLGTIVAWAIRELEKS